MNSGSKTSVVKVPTAWAVGKVPIHICIQGKGATTATARMPSNVARRHLKNVSR